MSAGLANWQENETKETIPNHTITIPLGPRLSMLWWLRRDLEALGAPRIPGGETRDAKARLGKSGGKRMTRRGDSS